ncbi:MAG: hypothetical protein IJ737_03835 [Ruminococcus sp.]|nr:hypothetical protein [Ruminococcus sp.]
MDKDKKISIDELLMELKEQRDRNRKAEEQKAEEAAAEKTEVKAEIKAEAEAQADKEKDEWAEKLSFAAKKEETAAGAEEEKAEKAVPEVGADDSAAEEAQDKADEKPEDEPSDGAEKEPENADRDSALDAALKIKELSDKTERETDETDETPVNRASIKNIKMGLTGKILPRTEEFDRTSIPDDASFEEKSAALYEHRRKKVENFVLSTDDEDNKERAESKEVYGQKEFSSFEDAPEILNDILQVKNNLFLRLCVLLFTGLFSLLITVANDLELPLIRIFDRSISPSSYLFTNTLLGLIAVGVSYTVMSAGVKNMVTRKPDCDSIAAIGIFVTVISGIVTLFDPESLRSGFYHVYVSAAIVALIFNTLGKMMIVQRTEKNFRYIAGEFDRYAVTTVDDTSAENFSRGYVGAPVRMGTMRKTEFVDDFIKNSYAPDISDTFAKRIAPLILLAGLAVGLLSFLTDKNAATMNDKIFVALASFSGTVTMCSSVSMMLAVNIPVTRASRKFLQYSSVMLGYSAVDEYGDANCVLTDAQQLFPKESVDLVNLKLLSTNSLEECILMAASISCQAGSVLQNSFYKILKGKTEMLHPVESYIFEDGQGLSGWIDNKRILLGTRNHMENHSIDGLPPMSKELEYGKSNVVIYLSINGVVSAMFVIRIAPGIAVTKWMQELEKEGMVTVVRTVDGFLSEELMEKIFGLSSGSVKMLPFRFHKEYADQTDYTERVSSSMLCSGHFPSFAMLLTGVKRIKNAAGLGISIQYGAVFMAIAICVISMLAGSFMQITPSLVILYNLVFAAVTAVMLHVKKI